jgi:hypothetical protein
VWDPGRHTWTNNRQMPPRLIMNEQNSEVVVSQPGSLLIVELLDLMLWNILAIVSAKWMMGTVSGKELTQLLTCRWVLLQSIAAKVEDKRSQHNVCYSFSNYYQISAGNCQKGVDLELYDWDNKAGLRDH